jgi:hypothetical protein
LINKLFEVGPTGGYKCLCIHVCITLSTSYGIISGGYLIGFHSMNSPFNMMVHSNLPLQKINKTGYFKGWEAGLVNKGNEAVTLSATTFCIGDIMVKIIHYTV